MSAPCSCRSSWTVSWACSVPTWRLRTEPPSSKISNCWRRSCRLSVGAASSLSLILHSRCPCFSERHSPACLPLQRPACLLCVRRGRWCWSRCAARSRGPWRRLRVQSVSSRTTCSTSRPSWRRCSSGSRGDAPLPFLIPDIQGSHGHGKPGKVTDFANAVFQAWKSHVIL